MIEGTLLDKLNVQNIYIAHQNTSSLDEIQRMCIGYMSGHPIALEGQPGMGKNHAINVLAKTFGKKEYRIRCTEEMLARDIIGGDKLNVEKSKNGSLATKSEFSKGKMIYAMSEGNFLILDEFNQLQSTVQKAFNSSLEEIQTIDSLDGGYETKAKKQFGLFITYNPDTGVQHQDLEPAVKDRCKIIHFNPLDPQLKTYLAMIKTKNLSLQEIINNDVLEIRGITLENGKPKFVRYARGTWIDTYKGQPIDGKKVLAYAYKNAHNESSIEFSDREKIDLYNVTNSIVRTLDDLEILRTQGTIPFARKFQNHELSPVSRLNITPSSPRILHKLIQDYTQLKDMNVPDRDIASDIVLSIIDYSVLHRERTENIGRDITVAGLVHQICAKNGLLTAHAAEDIRRRVNEAARRGAVNAFVEEGFTEEIAEDLVKRYITPRPNAGLKSNMQSDEDDDKRDDLPF